MTRSGNPRSTRLVVRTPTSVVVDDDVRSITAEDPSGRFGVRPRCEPVAAALIPGILTYLGVDDVERFIAIGSGVLFAEPDEIQVAVRDAVACASLEGLRQEMLTRVRTRRRGELAMQEVTRSMTRRFLKTLAKQERNR